MNILFISRTYPPIVGGMEIYSYNLNKQLSKQHKVYEIILKKRAINLIWFYPWIYIYGTYLILFKKIDIVYVGDGLLSSVALYFQSVLRKKVLLTIHGLDVIYDKLFYQLMQKTILPKIKNIVANSQATANEAMNRGVQKEKINIIPAGVETTNLNHLDKTKAIKQIEKYYNIILRNKTVLFTIGRLVKRKGVYWFIDKVMTKLDSKYILMIAGDGPEFSRIQALVLEKNLSNQVYLLGRVSEDEKMNLFCVCNCFISPNIIIENDMEGFGIVNLEAGLYGMPVVASNIQGIKDAVMNNITGYLVEEKNPQQFIDAIKKADGLNKSKIRSFIQDNYTWDSIYEKYMKVIYDL